MSNTNSVVVIYKSKYGTTKQYAEWIAQALDAPMLEASKVQPSQLESYDIVVFGGALYTGRIMGVSLVTKNPCKSLVLFTVGMFDPATTDFSGMLKKNLPEEIQAKAKIFHLHGRIDFKRLNFFHKSLMGIVRKSIMKKNESERTGEDTMIMQTYGAQMDFSDINAIDPIVDYVNNLRSS